MKIVITKRKKPCTFVMIKEVLRNYVGFVLLMYLVEFIVQLVFWILINLLIPVLKSTAFNIVASVFLTALLYISLFVVKYKTDRRAKRS